MVTWVDWLSNGLPPYAVYRAVNMVRTVALNKTPGMRPLRVREAWMHLWSDCFHAKTKVEATSACGNVQLCTGLWSGMKANLHAIQAIILSLPGGQRMVSALWSTMKTRRTTQLCCTFALKDCWPLRSTPGRLRTLASRAMSVKLALALLCLMPTTASTSSTITSCCGMLHTNGIMEASLRSTAISTVYPVLSGMSWGSQPLWSTQRRGSCKGTALPLYGVVLMLFASKMRKAIP